jgi:RNA polymerase sigma factor (sigma-70 family)
MIKPEGETETRPEGRPVLNAEAWVERYGDFLFRQAYVRLGKHEAAEDIVQEVFLAAWKSRDNYAGRASERTWLIQILRHKVADYFRRQRPEENLDEDELADLEESQFEGEAGKRTHWRSAMAPRAWTFPWQGLERAEFWQAVGHCTRRMPSRTAPFIPTIHHVIPGARNIDSQGSCHAPDIPNRPPSICQLFRCDPIAHLNHEPAS